MAPRVGQDLSPEEGRNFDCEWEVDPALLNQSKFDDFRKRRFLWYLEFYQNAIEKGITDEARRQGMSFIQMPFEVYGNSMTGEWNYINLQSRFLSLRDRLMEETHRWPVEGLVLVEEDAGIAVKLRGQHEQIAADMNAYPQVIDLSLVDGNPFVWRLTYVGRNESKLEGGIIKIKIYISPRHPEEQPRAFVEPPLFHIRVSKLGALMYLPSHADEIGQHIEGIINTLEDDDPPYNPLMTVNPEATALCWGSEVDRRLYRRKLRASLEES
jgi:ubiquitin-conjugating enzyme E2 Z